MSVEQRGQAIRVMINLVNWQQEEPTGCGGGRQPSLDGTSRVNREVYARFCERLGVQFPGPTRRRSAMVVPTATGLESQGFTVRDHNDPGLQGRDESNICNRGRLGAGIQFELSHGLRRSLFQSLLPAGRRLPTERFRLFVATVRDGSVSVKHNPSKESYLPVRS
jgi:hypothetical protein